MPPRTVVTTWMALSSPADFRPPAVIPPGLTLSGPAVQSPELNRFFYTAIGGDWSWTDRLGWKYDRWSEWLSRLGGRTVVLAIEGIPVGYAELSHATDGTVEIVLFGLLPQWIGRGLGGPALALVVGHAWEMGATRIVLNTCSTDHPHALDNYRARGFQVVRTAESVREVADMPPGPWPGAR
ncbi:MAG: GNAT family N-acetyltransferase [Gemmatimonadales bacterium]